MSFADDIARAIRQQKALDRVLDNGLDSAAKAGAERFVEGAKQRVPKRTGDLEKSIKEREEEKRTGYAAHVAFSDLFYSLFVEDGHTGALIVPNKAQALLLGDEFYASATSGSASPRPFWRITAEQDGNEIAQAIQSDIVRQVNAAL